MKWKYALLRWWWLVVTVATGLILAAFGGAFEYVYGVDQTYLTYVISVLFVAATVWAGYLTSWFKKVTDGNDIYEIDEIENRLEIGWFASRLCQSIGMVGTVIGFIIMLQGIFSNFDLGNQQAVKQMLVSGAEGMATAFVTTLVGLVASILLRLQYFNLEQSIEDRRL